MKVIKGFNRDMTCRGYQFREGETYEEQDAVLCKSGFHAVTRPLDVLNYYPPGTSVYHEAELEDVSAEKSDDSKVCGKRITIGARLSIRNLIDAQIAYIRESCTNEQNAEPGKPATAGDCGVATVGEYGAATVGDCGVATAGEHGAATVGECGVATAGAYGAATAGECGAATAGEYGAATVGEYGAATAGNRGAATAGAYGAATAGECGAATVGNRGAATAGAYGAATAGECGAATVGEYGAATAGNRGAATAGNRGAATSRGIASVGAYGIATVRGNGCRVRGGIGALLVIAEESSSNYDINSWKAVVVDGENIKADTWYILSNGELTEVDDPDHYANH